MTMLLTPPHIQLLLAAQQDLDAVDWLGLTGVDGITVRQSRNRPPPAESVNQVVIVFRGFALDEQITFGEYQYSLDFELVIDVTLPTEDSDQDPTGWLKPSLIAAAAVNAVSVGAMRALCQDVQQGDGDPDEEASGPDNARLVQGMSVLYRVLTDNPNVLLAEGVNGG